LIWRIRERGTFEALRREGIRARSGPIGITFLPDAPPDPAPPDPSSTPDDRGATGISGAPPPILEPGPLPPRLAFAIGRRVGHAVERNRLRRRLRAIFADLARQDPVALQPGAYLVGCQVGAVGLTHEELREHVSRALIRINRVVAR
jgi:ribonuclease P protein component